MTGVPAAAIEASRILLDALPIGIAIYGADAALVLANPAFAEVLGAPPPALNADRSGIGVVQRRSTPGGATVEVRTLPLAFGGHVSLATDVTALASMLAHIQHGIVLWDRDGRIVACNKIMLDVVGAPEGFLVPGRSLEEVIQAALERGTLGRGRTAAARADVLRDKDRSLSSIDQRLTRQGRVLEVRSDPTPDGGFVTTYTDVTPIREAEDALKQAKLAAEAANAAKSRTMAAMGQELQRPLRNILDQADALRRWATDASGRHAVPLEPPAVLDAAEAVLTAGRQLMATVDVILDVARLEAGRFDLSSEAVDIARLVQACLRQMDAHAAAAELVLSVDLADGLPDVLGDGRRLGHVLNHLVHNAVRFTGPHGAVTIAAQMDAATNALLLTVRDTGIGIAEADLDHVFEPFTRLGPGLDGTARAQGLGLGLYLGRAVMHAHGGQLVLHSRPGHGTEAVMHLPPARVLDRRHAAPT